MLKLDQHRELWHYDSDGNRVCTSIRKRIPFMEGIRSDGLSLPRKEKTATWSRGDGSGLSLQANSIGEAQLHQAHSIWDLPEVVDDNNSASSGSGVTYLGLKVWTGDGDVELSSASVEEEDDGSNPDWDGDVCSGEVEEEESGESMMGCFRRVIETPLWDCLTSSMRTRSIKWNIARLYVRSICRIFHFPAEERR